MQRDCKKCGQPIPHERLEILPNTHTCVHCSDVGTVIGFMVPTANKGCAPEIQMVSTKDTEGVRQALRAHRRSR